MSDLVQSLRKLAEMVADRTLWPTIERRVVLGALRDAANRIEELEERAQPTATSEAP